MLTWDLIHLLGSELCREATGCGFVAIDQSILCSFLAAMVSLRRKKKESIGEILNWQEFVCLFVWFFKWLTFLEQRRVYGCGNSRDFVDALLLPAPACTRCGLMLDCRLRERERWLWTWRRLLRQLSLGSRGEAGGWRRWRNEKSSSEKLGEFLF